MKLSVIYDSGLHANTLCTSQFVFVRSVPYDLSEFQALFHHVVYELLGSKVDHDIGEESHERLHKHAASER